MPTKASLVGHASLILALFVSAGHSAAFEIGGFKSGMSSAEARAAAIELGWTIVAVAPPMGPKVPAARTSFNMTNGKTSLEFCDDRLASVRTVVPDGFEGMVSVIADLIDQYGEPQTNAYSLEVAQSDASSLSFTWKLEDGERREILYTKDGSAEEPWALYFLTAMPGLCSGSP
jgi:hypothetical protein